MIFVILIPSFFEDLHPSLGLVAHRRRFMMRLCLLLVEVTIFIFNHLCSLYSTKYFSKELFTQTFSSLFIRFVNLHIMTSEVAMSVQEYHYAIRIPKTVNHKYRNLIVRNFTGLCIITRPNIFLLFSSSLHSIALSKLSWISLPLQVITLNTRTSLSVCGRNRLRETSSTAVQN